MLDTRDPAPYVMRVQILVFSPVRGAVLRAERDGAIQPFGTGTERGRAVGIVFVDVPPGGSRTVEVTLLTGPLPSAGTTVTPRLRTTTGVAPWRTSVAPFPGCG
jgi:hypothetical protein